MAAYRNVIYAPLVNLQMTFAKLPSRLSNLRAKPLPLTDVMTYESEMLSLKQHYS